MIVSVIGGYSLRKGWFGMVFGVWNEIVDSLARYLVYGVGMWMVWKSAQSTDWVSG
jgi:hypothetical protein